MALGLAAAVKVKQRLVAAGFAATSVTTAARSGIAATARGSSTSRFGLSAALGGFAAAGLFAAASANTKHPIKQLEPKALGTQA
jgi:hypothetical protein